MTFIETEEVYNTGSSSTRRRFHYQEDRSQMSSELYFSTGADPISTAGGMQDNPFASAPIYPYSKYFLTVDTYGTRGLDVYYIRSLERSRMLARRAHLLKKQKMNSLGSQESIELEELEAIVDKRIRGRVARNMEWARELFGDSAD